MKQLLLVVLFCCVSCGGDPQPHHDGADPVILAALTDAVAMTTTAMGASITPRRLKNEAYRLALSAQHEAINVGNIHDGQLPNDAILEECRRQIRTVHTVDPQLNVAPLTQWLFDHGDQLNQQQLLLLYVLCIQTRETLGLNPKHGLDTGGRG